MVDLQTVWDSLIQKYCGDSSLKRNYWEEIEKAYSSPKRHYHNLSHLTFMFRKVESYKDLILDVDTLSFSIFYHDIVYKSTASNNEEKSATLAKKRLELLGVKETEVAKCHAQILATKTHTLSEESDTNYLVDIDLAILGESPEIYQEYTQNIRKEYAIFPEFVYKRGRAKVVNHFLNMSKIYKTKLFQDQLEFQARTNLAHELKGLE